MPHQHHEISLKGNTRRCHRGQDKMTFSGYDTNADGLFEGLGW